MNIEVYHDVITTHDEHKIIYFWFIYSAVLEWQLIYFLSQWHEYFCKYLDILRLCCFGRNMAAISFKVSLLIRFLFYFFALFYYLLIR